MLGWSTVCWDATALCRGGSRWFLRGCRRALGCHGLVPWWLPLVSTGVPSSAGMPRPCAVVAPVGFYGGAVERWDATALCRGGSRWFLGLACRATSVSHHGTRPWHRRGG